MGFPIVAMPEKKPHRVPEIQSLFRNGMELGGTGRNVGKAPAPGILGSPRSDVRDVRLSPLMLGAFSG